MIGATVGILYAVVAVGVWCFGAYYIQAHYEDLDRKYIDMFAPWLIVIFAGAAWPIGIPVYVAGVMGARLHQQRKREAAPSGAGTRDHQRPSINKNSGAS